MRCCSEGLKLGGEGVVVRGSSWVVIEGVVSEAAKAGIGEGVVCDER